MPCGLSGFEPHETWFRTSKQSVEVNGWRNCSCTLRKAGCSPFQLLQIVHVQELQWANSDSEDDDDDDDSEDLCGPQTIQSDHSGF